MIEIYSKFDNLKLDKKNEIIDAALKEFSESGFDKASTNIIVKNAGISKGALFNYFKSKKGLYLYLVDFSTVAFEAMFDNLDLSESDIFTRISDIGTKKLKIYHNNPHIFDFLSATQKETSKVVVESIGTKVDKIYEVGIKKMYQDVDYSLFKSGIDVEKAVEIINWTMIGFGSSVMKNMDDAKDGSKIIEESIEAWESYTTILKDSFYK